MGKRAILFTVYDRPQYLRETLMSWSEVRGLEDWDIYFSIEPSPVQHEVFALIREFCERKGLARRPGDQVVEVRVNETVLGVLVHPFVGFERLFGEGYEFVLRAEDDLIVSDDILEFFGWANVQFEEDPWVVCVCSASNDAGDPSDVRLTTSFSPWLWGTWPDRWTDVLGPTWDKDYSTFNGYPGHQSGWDWNIHTRVMPERGLRAASPVVSRVDNIGVFGTHGTASNFVTMRGFQAHHEPQEFRYT